jgi:hypothetical protein
MSKARTHLGPHALCVAQLQQRTDRSELGKDTLALGLDGERP